MRCAYCGSQAHTLEYCPKTWGGQGNRNALRCAYCGARDHDEQACLRGVVGAKWDGRGVRILDARHKGFR